MSVTTIGIDLAKNVFHIHGVDADGRSVLRRKTSRAGFERLMAGIPGCLVGMEAGSGSHHWARQLRAHGHDVKLMPPRYVRPMSRPTNMTRLMPRLVARQSSDQGCASFR